MTTEVKRRRGTTAQHATFTGALGEFTYDTDKKVVVAHDGSTSGGFPMDRERTLASEAQARAGSDNVTIMTPLRVKQAIDSLSSQVVIERKSLAGLTFADFTAIRASEFDQYIIDLSDLVPTTNAVVPYLRYMTGGAQISTGNAYRDGEFRFTGSATGNAGSLSANEMALIRGETLGNSAPSMRASGRIFCDINGATAKNIRALLQGFWASSTHVGSDVFGYVASGADIDGFRLFLSSGTFAGGYAKLIGIRSTP